MGKRWVVLFCAAWVAGLGLAVWLFPNERQDTASPADRIHEASSLQKSASELPAHRRAKSDPIAARWSLGIERVYEVRTQNEATYTNGSETRRFHTSSLGLLSVAVVESSEVGDVRIRIALKDASITANGTRLPDEAALLAIGWTAVLSGDGAVAELAVSDSLRNASHALGVAKQLTANMQMVVREGQAWEAMEQDANGRLRVRYAREGRDIRKERVAYETFLHEGGEAAVRGRTTFSRLRNGWPGEIHGNTAADFDFFGGETSVRHMCEFSYRLSATHANTQMARATDEQTVALDEAILPAAQMASADEQTLGAATFESLRGELLTIRRQFEGASARDARADVMSKLSVLFRLHPETILDGVRFVREEADTKETGIVASALSEVASDEASEVLSELVLDPKLDVEKRRSVSRSMALMDKPSETTLDALSRMSQSTDEALARAALFALGSQVRRFSGDGSSVVEMLLERLASASSTQETVVLLSALGNAGDARALDALVRYSRHPETQLRAEGVESLRFISDRRADEAILAALFDPDVEVRSAAVRIIEFRDFWLYAPALERLSDDEPDPRLRAAIVRLRSGRS